MNNQYTIPTSTAAKQKEIEKLSGLEKFALNGYLVSEAPASEKIIIAYEISRPKQSQANRQSIYMLARKWVNSDKCTYYLEQRKTELFTHDNKRTKLTDTAGNSEENDTDNVKQVKG